MFEDRGRNEKKMKSVRVNVTNILQYNFLSQLNEKNVLSLTLFTISILELFFNRQSSLRKIKRQLFHSIFILFYGTYKTFHDEIQVLEGSHGGISMS